MTPLELDVKEIEEIVRRILQEQLQTPKSTNKCLALFTGGVIGLDEVLMGLLELQGTGLEITSLLSTGAQQVIGTDKITTTLNGSPVYTEDHPGPTGTMLQDVDLVIVPVLTMNTAAKVSLGIADNLVTTIFRNAILMGKHILAVKNACDLYNPVRAQLGHNQGPGAYGAMLGDHLDRLQCFGVNFIAATELPRAVRSVLEPTPVTLAPASLEGKRLISSEDLLPYPEGETLVVDAGVLFTPLARDLVESKGLVLVTGVAKNR